MDTKTRTTELEALKVTELRKIARKQGAPVGGLNKADLVKLILINEEKNTKPAKAKTAKPKAEAKSTRRGKLTDAQVKAIVKDLRGEGKWTVIAREHGVSMKTVHSIMTGTGYKHVTGGEVIRTTKPRKGTPADRAYHTAS